MSTSPTRLPFSEPTRHAVSACRYRTGRRADSIHGRLFIVSNAKLVAVPQSLSRVERWNRGFEHTHNKFFKSIFFRSPVQVTFPLSCHCFRKARCEWWQHGTCTCQTLQARYLMRESNKPRITREQTVALNCPLEQAFYSLHGYLDVGKLMKLLHFVR